MTTVNNNTNTIRILIVDDRLLIRETIQMYLSQETDLEVVGHGQDGATALEQIEKLNPDVVILDLEMPDTDVNTTIKTICNFHTNTKVLVLSSHEDREHINQAIEAGAKGYLTKGTPAKELADAVRSVYRGYFQLGPGLLEKLVISMSSSASKNSRSLEEKLIVALKKFKQDSDRQINKQVKTELDKNSGYLEQQIELKVHGFKHKHNELYKYVRNVEYKVYLLLLVQVIFIFALAISWII